MRCEACGRPVLVRPAPRGRKRRENKPRPVEGHTLCQRCWEAELDRRRARGM